MTKVSEMSQAERSAAYIEILNDSMITCGKQLQLTVEETLDLELRHSVAAYAQVLGIEKTAEMLKEFGERNYCVLPLEVRKPRGDAGSKTGRSEEHTSELQSLIRTSYSAFSMQ